ASLLHHQLSRFPDGASALGADALAGAVPREASLPYSTPLVPRNTSTAGLRRGFPYQCKYATVALKLLVPISTLPLRNSETHGRRQLGSAPVPRVSEQPTLPTLAGGSICVPISPYHLHFRLGIGLSGALIFKLRLRSIVGKWFAYLNEASP